MEVEMSEPWTYSGKKFEFCDIKWVFENFFLASCKEKFILRTPEFTIRGFHTTRWVMILTFETGEIEDIVKLSLKRCDSDPGPEMIWVDWRIEMHCPSCEQEMNNTVNKLCCFRKGSLIEEELGCMASKLIFLKPFESDSYELSCKMILFNDESSKGFQPCCDSSIRSLSEDLLQLFHGNEYQDLELKFEMNSMRVHKIVACSRLKELNSFIEERRKYRDEKSGEGDVVDLSCLNYDAMVKLMKYAYTGDLKHVIGEPSLSIYDCIQEFEMPEIKSYYVPYKLCFRSSVNKSEFNFEWIIPEKRNMMCKKESMKSPVFADDSSGTIWQLHLAPSDGENSDYFDLRVENMVEKEFVAYIDCGIADENDIYFFVQRYRCPPQALKMYDIYQFLSLNVLKSFSDDKRLCIVIRIRLSDGSSSTCIEKQKLSFVECTPPERCYHLLSVHMDSAYNAEFFSDLHLEINGIVYKLHKSIIAARCSKMYEMVCQMSQDGVNPFSEIEPNIFCMVMRFLYSGIVVESGCEGDVVDLYQAAMDFDLPTLKDSCLQLLKVFMENNLVFRAKVLELSEKHNDPLLKECVRKYISEI